MKSGTIIGMVATGILVVVAAVASGFVGWMMWARIERFHGPGAGG